ncbi:MAG: tRNA (adenosine(37)-N6)-threonylcarbamoyltransferase complex transferase subunit TsaD [bacterium]
MQPQHDLVVLGIETSCDETAAAVLRRHADGRYEILSNIIHSQFADHADYGGVVPEIAARAHVEKADHVIEQALQQVGMADAHAIQQLDAVAATQGPGLVGGVMVGLTSGKAIALAHNLPFVPVNHLEGHALSVLLTDPSPFPFLLLLVSGGHTQLLLVTAPGVYRRLGTTIDDAAGEAFDKTAKLLKLGQPGGPLLEALAALGDASAYDMPRPLLKRAGCDFSFSGLKTATRLLTVEVLEQVNDNDQKGKADIAASFQKAAIAHLATRTQKAMQQLGQEGQDCRHLVIAGGVAANKALRAEFDRLTQNLGWTLTVPPAKYCTDNGAMIAIAGAERLRRDGALSLRQAMGLPAKPRWPLDDKPDGVRHGGGKKGPKA